MRNLAAVLVVSLAVCAAAPATAAKPISHLFQAIEDHVVLRATASRNTKDCPSLSEFHRVFPDGTVDERRFGVTPIPAGRLLVVTDVDWRVEADRNLVGPGLDLNAALASFRIRIGGDANVFTLPTLYHSQWQRFTSINDVWEASGNDTWTTGITIDHPETTCVAVESTQLEPGVDLGGITQLLAPTEVILRGYLIDAP